MANVLNQYLQLQAAIQNQIRSGGYGLDGLPVILEVNYRISVLETFRDLQFTAPQTLDTNAMGYHYQLVDACIQFLQAERKFGPKVDTIGLKKRETAANSLAHVINDQRKRFSSFRASTPDQYRNSIADMINTILPVWISYRNTYFEI